ncbi:MAG: NAD+ synthase [Saprospiraceae bacterium]|nr:NAD+ synthase [Saprospiraceae bacterium]
MKIALAQLNYIIGDFEHNYQKMASHVEKAKAAGADLVVFSELAVCGYPPRDFLEFPDFIHRCDAVVQQLAALSQDIGIIVGAPAINPVPEGKDLFNCAYLLHEGKIQHVAKKALLPTYDIFDEYRYFEPATTFNNVEFKGKKIALTVCEDIWNIGNENPLYTICPMDELTKGNPDFMINISASPFTYDKAEERIRIVRENVARYGVPMFYSNHVGAQTEILFDGASLVVNAGGVVVDEMPYFEEAFQVYDLGEVTQATENKVRPKEKIALIHDALVMGIRNYFQKLGFSKAILGLSGGIDSAVTLALAVEALGKENVLSVLMPSQFSSDHSVNDSVQLCHNLESPYKTIPIKGMFDAFMEELTPHFEGKPFNVAEENIQARSRGMLLMALSNKHGYILLNTSNKSEAAVGYGTLYGDMAGGLSVIGDVYKVDVFALARYMNRHGEVVPENIITKPPSAELRPDQKDSDSLPEYDVLDEILMLYIEQRMGPKEIIAQGHDPKLVHRILRLVNRSEYKRYQTPPMLRVSPKAFGMGRRMPIVAKYLEQS